MIPFFQSTDLEFDHFLARGLPSVRPEATDILAPGQTQWPLTGVPASAFGPLQCVLHMAHSAVFKQGPTVLRLNAMPWQWLEAPRSSPALTPSCSHLIILSFCSSHTSFHALPWNLLPPFHVIWSLFKCPLTKHLPTPPLCFSPAVSTLWFLSPGEGPGFDRLKFIQLSKVLFKEQNTKLCLENCWFLLPIKLPLFFTIEMVRWLIFWCFSFWFFPRYRGLVHLTHFWAQYLVRPGSPHTLV